MIDAVLRSISYIIHERAIVHELESAVELDDFVFGADNIFKWHSRLPNEMTALPERIHVRTSLRIHHKRGRALQSGSVSGSVHLQAPGAVDLFLA